tara:strand:+ start:688 stop:1701 length:1014 start_codon:yes stop_codon:yes gene_type:complete
VKSVFLVDHYNEADVKPAEMLNAYVQLAEKNVNDLFLRDTFVNCDCPGCGASDRAETFRRFNLDYVSCPRCHTLWVSPRPDDESIKRYYANSDAEIYWREKLSRETALARVERIVLPRVDWIIDSTQQYLPDADHFVDIGTHHDVYARCLSEIGRFSRKTLLNPICEINPGALAHSTNIVNEHISKAMPDNSVDAISMFEVLDRTSNIDGAMSHARRMLRPGGLIFITGILSTGFDIMTLWDQAQNIFPPDRLNVFSVEGLTMLMERHGFNVLEFSTPGMFDTEAVIHAVETNPKIQVPRFVSYMLENRGPEGRQRFQEFLQMNLLSSFGRVLAQRQ